MRANTQTWPLVTGKKGAVAVNYPAKSFKWRRKFESTIKLRMDRAKDFSQKAGFGILWCRGRNASCKAKETKTKSRLGWTISKRQYRRARSVSFIFYQNFKGFVREATGNFSAKRKRSSEPEPEFNRRITVQNDRCKSIQSRLGPKIASTGVKARLGGGAKTSVKSRLGGLDTRLGKKTITNEM